MLGLGEIIAQVEQLYNEEGLNDLLPAVMQGFLLCFPSAETARTNVPRVEAAFVIRSAELVTQTAHLVMTGSMVHDR